MSNYLASNFRSIQTEVTDSELDVVSRVWGFLNVFLPFFRRETVTILWPLVTPQNALGNEGGLVAVTGAAGVAEAKGLAEVHG